MASRITSRHHWIIVMIITTEARNAPIEAVRGHGLGSTRWNGCRGIYVSYWCRLFTWKVTVLVILEAYKRA